MMSNIEATWTKGAKLTGSGKTIFWTTNSWRNQGLRNLSVGETGKMMMRKRTQREWGSCSVVRWKIMGRLSNIDWKVPSSNY